MTRQALKDSLIRCTLLLVLGCLADCALAAGCSRAVSVAASPVGRAMTVSTGGDVGGTVKDFLDKISASTGCVFEYQAMPRARAWMKLQTGAIDLLPAAAQTPERDAQGLFVPTHRVAPRLITLHQRTLPIASIEALLRSRIHVGIVRGYQFGPAFDNLVSNLALEGRLHVVADPDAIVRILAAGRVDAVILPLSALAEAAEAAKLHGNLRSSLLSGLPPSRIGFYVSTAALTEADRDTLSASIARAVERGEYRRLMRRHYPTWSLPDVTAD